MDLGRTADLGAAYSLQVSADGSVWSTVHATTPGTAETAVRPLPGGTSGRYMHVHATERSAFSRQA